MEEVEIRFGEGREGIVPVGTYLIDAARRMGAAALIDCGPETGHECGVKIEEGGELLSQITEAESDLLSDEQREQGTRLACYAKIEKPGVITAMVEKKTDPDRDEKQAEERDEAYRKEFTELPLEKKIANLMQLEAIALGETFAFVINSPFKVFEKIGDVMAEFGFKKEVEQKKRARPAESTAGKSKAKANGSETESESNGV